LGAIYGIWTVVQNSRIPNGAVLLLMFAVMVFLVGLVSEQISTLRFEGRDARAASELSESQTLTGTSHERSTKSRPPAA
jgi:hypothetical protein